MASLTINITDGAERQLRGQAEAAGKSLEELASDVLQLQASAATRLREISGQVYDRFLATGMTDEQLADALEQEDHHSRGVPYNG
jgi:hypothetical protein